MDTWLPNLSWITELLAVGGSFPAHGVEWLAREHRVRAVVDLRGEATPEARALHRHGVTLLHLPTEDMCGLAAADLEHGLHFAGEHLDQGRRVLVHCEHGIGRSATLALCLLVRRGHTPLEALTLMKKQRPVVSPSPGQFACWTTWLERHRGAHAAAWTVPSFDEFQAIAYRNAGSG